MSVYKAATIVTLTKKIVILLVEIASLLSNRAENKRFAKMDKNRGARSSPS